MALNNTMHDMERLLKAIGDDLEKTIYGNKAAAQRVRTGTIRLEKIAKLFRKESIHAEKKGLLVRKPRPKKSAKKADSEQSHAPKKAAKAHKKAAPKKAAKAHKKAAPKKAAKAAHKKAAPKKVAKVAHKKAAPKKAVHKKAAAPKKKIKAKPRTLSLRRPTAKLPRKHMRAR